MEKKNGKLHRDDIGFLPAVTNDNRWTDEEWWIDDKRIK